MNLTLTEIKGYIVMGLGALLLFSTQLFSSSFNALNLNDPLQKQVAGSWAMMAFLGGFAVMLLGLAISLDMTKWRQEFPRTCTICRSGMKAEEPYDIVTDGYAHQDKAVCDKQKRQWRIIKPIFLGVLGAPVIGVLAFAVGASAGILAGLGIGGLLIFSFYLSVWRDKQS